MSFSILTNIITMMFCGAVLIQSVRLIRCLRAVKGVAFGEMVAALDRSTIQAKAVLKDLREILQNDCAANARVIASGVAMRDELTVMTGIADAVAERIVSAVELSKQPTPQPRPKLSLKPKAESQPAEAVA